MAFRTPTAVLFLCAGNSTRSILAEATLRHLAGSRWTAHSAGLYPVDHVHRHTLWQLETAQMKRAGLSSKSWQAFRGPEAPKLDAVITLCNDTAAWVQPEMFGDAALAHWSVADPLTSLGDERFLRRAFADAHRWIRHRVERLIELPAETFDRSTLEAHLRAIGESHPFRATSLRREHALRWSELQLFAP
ncbi:MAG: arsenate reductase ArsC [Proteobacteria bacterium]|nr:arsenate reductase ArsC [Pseudomonadota bacterium]